jgi:hypothetical protein
MVGDDVATRHKNILANSTCRWIGCRIKFQLSVVISGDRSFSPNTRDSVRAITNYFFFVAVFLRGTFPPAFRA